VPVGEQRLTAKRGAFEVTFSVNVEPGAIVEAESAPLEAVQALGYVSGVFDSIEDIVTALGNEITEIDNDDLSDASLLQEYAIIFINCGAYSFTESRASALAEYVNNGGTLYVSDLESQYISALFPGDVTFSGNSSPEAIDSEVTDAGLQAWIGTDQVTITYDAGGWDRVTAVDNEASVLLRGQPAQLDTGDEPLAITFPLGSGRVVYTTFHNTSGIPGDQESILRYYIYLGV
jgi:hypothetical protein